MGIFEKFKLGFKKSANNIASGLREIIVKKEIDDITLNKIEEFLISSDVGIDAASEIKDIVAQRKIDPKEDPIIEVNKILKEYIIELMQPLEKKKFFEKKDNLNVILVSGVNGVGKTTTIGKIGKIFQENNNEVLFSACDTFRAAAIDQLEKWAEKVNATILNLIQVRIQLLLLSKRWSTQKIIILIKFLLIRLEDYKIKKISWMNSKKLQM